jgi:hypothetical protein
MGERSASRQPHYLQMVLDAHVHRQRHEFGLGFGLDSPRLSDRTQELGRVERDRVVSEKLRGRGVQAGPSQNVHMSQIEVGSVVGSLSTYRTASKPYCSRRSSSAGGMPFLVA